MTNNFYEVMEQVFKTRGYGEVKMRDPQRINRILNLIATIWLRHPDMRLGQLLYNYAGFKDGDYNTEDDITEERLKEFVSTIKRTEEEN